MSISYRKNTIYYAHKPTKIYVNSYPYMRSQRKLGLQSFAPVGKDVFWRSFIIWKPEIRLTWEKGKGRFGLSETIDEI